MELYHVLNRGVDKRSIAMDNKDKMRFVCNLYELNDEEHVFNLGRSIDIGRRSFTRERKPLVTVHGWCLMKNHYHLLLSAVAEKGISRFLQKINMGYTKYFNERHDRSGALFQGKTKQKHINSDAYFLHILHYIHLNPLDYLHGSAQWRERNIENAEKAIIHIARYRWSSYGDYCEGTDFLPIISPELFREVFGDYKKVLTEYVRDIETAKVLYTAFGPRGFE
jgi:putative transposase